MFDRWSEWFVDGEWNSCSEGNTMNHEWTTSMVCGLIGSLVAFRLVVWWSKWAPEEGGGYGEHFVAEFRGRIRVANFLTCGAFVIGFVLYQWDIISSDDWRGAALTAGLAAALPIVWIVATTIVFGIRKTRDCIIALAIVDRTPIPVLVAFLALFLCLGFAGGGSLYYNR